MAVRHAVLPIGAVLVLGLGVYLFFEVRAQPASPLVDRTLPVPHSAQPAVPQAVAPRDAPAGSDSPPPDQPDPPPSSEHPVLRPSSERPPPVALGRPDDAGAGPARDPDALLYGRRLDAVLAEANKAYDRGDFEEAKTIAGRVLAKFPTNIRMQRIMVSASCIDGDNASAQSHFQQLPSDDQEQMRVRCARFGINFPDKP